MSKDNMKLLTKIGDWLVTGQMKQSIDNLVVSLSNLSPAMQTAFGEMQGVNKEMGKSNQYLQKIAEFNDQSVKLNRELIKMNQESAKQTELITLLTAVLLWLGFYLPVKEHTGWDAFGSFAGSLVISLLLTGLFVFIVNRRR